MIRRAKRPRYFRLHAIKAGMTMGIVNAGMIRCVDLEPGLRERAEVW
jgi:cobalamin-dependent methionine synthase I